MRRVFLPLALIVGFALAMSGAEELPYLGHWSNGRGETLVLTTKTLRFAHDKPATYRDVTSTRNGTRFELQITTAGEVNAFPGKTVGVKIADNPMEMTTFSSHADYVKGTGRLSKVTWFKDSDEPGS